MPDDKKIKPVEDKVEGKREKILGEIKKPIRRKKKPVTSLKVKEKKISPKDTEEKTVAKKESVSKEELVVEVPVEKIKPISAPEVSNRPEPKRDMAPRRHRIDLSEIKPNIKYIGGLKGKRSIVGLTAYDAIMSKLIAKAGVDFILVGDSVGTTLLGYETTIPVTIDDMVHHTAAVRRGQPGCLVVADLPFGEASLSFDRLLDSSRRLMQNGADAVKIEGGKDIADDIEKLVATGIPVMGHIGLLPQTVKAIGGYRKFGASREEADSLYTDAISLEEAGCFAVIAEMMDERIATQLATQILPPLIGIGSGNQCDGQILVTHDLIGLTPSPLPSFVNPCATLGLDGLNALTSYVQKTRNNPIAKK
jgi:3-methyl-2-oxobutanoate hydroxymethyltransferase